jgi:small subunit ribosomal protein S17
MSDVTNNEDNTEVAIVNADETANAAVDTTPVVDPAAVVEPDAVVDDAVPEVAPAVAEEASVPAAAPVAAAPEVSAPAVERKGPVIKAPVVKETKPVVESLDDTRGNPRKVREGIVVSDKMDMTLVVAVNERVRHPRYGKTVQRTKKLYVHDEKNDAKIGDRVRVQETRPLSKLKRWRLTEVVERAR